MEIGEDRRPKKDGAYAPADPSWRSAQRWRIAWRSPRDWLTAWGEGKVGLPDRECKQRQGAGYDQPSCRHDHNSLRYEVTFLRLLTGRLSLPVLAGGPP